ncbi:MAG: ATP-binding protein [Bacteroidota bacterium]|nr:ATP-binding protein [Bacteroidota bacterium]
MAFLNILVIDDEPGIRSGVSRILRNFKVDYPFMDEFIEFNVLEAETGEQGLEIIKEKEPEIILLDNKLPGMQGIEVLEHLKKMNSDSVVVMITSYASLELAIKATKDGAHDFIPKPFTPQELRSSIETITKHIFLKNMTRRLNKEGKQIRFQFLSILSHELKAPINAIEGYLRMMNEKQFGENISSYKQIIDRCQTRTDGMRKLIMDMLDMTKLESGESTKDIKDINLIDSINNAVDTMQPFAIQKDVSIHVNVPKESIYHCDKEDMDIILNNLISNSIKYNKKNGRVDVELTEDDNNIEIKISDTGIGITKEDISKLFSDFVRIKNEKTKKITGTGLGLSIVKKLTDSYNGTIKVSSIPDKGSTFVLSLPKITN